MRGFRVVSDAPRDRPRAVEITGSDRGLQLRGTLRDLLKVVHGADPADGDPADGDEEKGQQNADGPPDPSAPDGKSTIAHPSIQA